MAMAGPLALILSEEEQEEGMTSLRPSPLPKDTPPPTDWAQEERSGQEGPKPSCSNPTSQHLSLIHI